MSYDPASPGDPAGQPLADDNAMFNEAAPNAGGADARAGGGDKAIEPTGDSHDITSEGEQPTEGEQAQSSWRDAPGSRSYRDAEAADAYADVPASLELAYTPADLGLSASAWERAYPYESVETRRRRRSGVRLRRVGRELVETVILALLIFFAVRAVVQNFRVEGSSMDPSLHSNQYLLVNKAIYFQVDMDRVHDFLPFVPGNDGEKKHLFRAPRRGDVIVFKFPLDPSRDFIKRVIGVPGDAVEVHDEKVFINGSPLKEDYILDPPNYTYGPKTVPARSYFVLGDNRRNSYDSHAWGTGCTQQQQCDFVPEEDIIGQAWLSYWPFDELGFVNNKKIRPQAP